MVIKLRTLVPLMIALVASGAAPTPVGDGAPRKYRVDMKTEVTLRDGENAPKKIDAVATFLYTFTPKPDGLEVAFDEMFLKGGESGAMMNMRMNNQGTTEVRDGKTTTTPIAELPLRQRVMLATFGQPMAKITLDERGGEVKREMLLKIGPLARPGMLDNARFFHVPFDPKAEAWDAEVSLPMAGAQKVRGKLHFEKMTRAGDAKPDSLVRCKVSGELAADKAESPQIKNGRYTIAGEQVYDPRVGDWFSASWDMSMSFELDTPRDKGKASGTMTLTLRRRED